MTKQDFLKSIPGIIQMSTIFAQTTKMPMVFCDEETMDDYIYIYMQDAEAIERAKTLTEEKNPAVAIKCKGQEVLHFFGSLRAIGVNAVCFVVDKEERFMVQLSEFLREPDLSKVPVEKHPIENPSLHLSMLYFMQEVRKPVDKEEKKNIKELEEETSANIAKAKLIVPIKNGEGEDKDKKAVMLLKNDKDQVFVPAFTDLLEVRKFMKDQKTGVIATEFKVVADMALRANATGVSLNPASTNVVLNVEGIKSVLTRFPQ